ncbi:hypothetical protein KDA23_07380 [Candidatus Saccharibacteria bacterium]|nr:hypothetical protein [Candidatus Saccharibacteria bacterium]
MPPTGERRPIDTPDIDRVSFGVALMVHDKYESLTCDRSNQQIYRALRLLGVTGFAYFYTWLLTPKGVVPRVVRKIPTLNPVAHPTLHRATGIDVFLMKGTYRHQRDLIERVGLVKLWEQLPYASDSSYTIGYRSLQSARSGLRDRLRKQLFVPISNYVPFDIRVSQTNHVMRAHAFNWVTERVVPPLEIDPVYCNTLYSLRPLFDPSQANYLDMFM